MRSRLVLITLGGALLVAPAALALVQLDVQQALQEKLAPLGLDLADSTAEEPVQPWTRVVINATQILVDDTPLPFALQTGPRGRLEIPSSEKRGQLVTTLYEELLQRHEVGVGLAALTSGASGYGELLVVADHHTPFELLRDVMYTAGQAQFGRYGLVVDNPWTEGLALVPVHLPMIAPPPPPGAMEEEPALDLTVSITDHGHEVRGSGRLRELGDARIICRGGGACAGPGDYDWEQLSARLQAIKTRFPHEVVAHVAPEADVDLEVIVRTADALRWGPVLDPQASHALWTQWQGSRSDLFPALVITGGAL